MNPRFVLVPSAVKSIVPLLLASPILAPDHLCAPVRASEPIILRDVANESGVRFRFHAGSRGRHDLPEIMGGGVAVLDQDGDGHLDIVLCNGGPIVPAPGILDPPSGLYRNRGDGTFEDLTPRADLRLPSYAMGTAVGDYDGDGRPDLLLTGWRDQRLYRNLGAGRFRDVTAAAGLVSQLWSTSAAFADLDGDGDLDLYVANYLDYDPGTAPYCAAPDGRPDYCGPEDFEAQPDRLYRNNGDGTFTDVSRAAGIELPGGRGLGVLIADLTGDRLPDVFVANDGSPCWLFANREGLRFEEIATHVGLARDGHGRDLAGMGIALGDIDGDGLGDLAVTNFLGRYTVGFRATTRGGRSYIDASTTLGLAAATRQVLGFGIALVDLDGDGRLDLIQANGHVLDRARLGDPLAMRPTLLQGSGGRLVAASDDASAWFKRPVLGRGLAVGDLDGDSRPDIVINVLDGPALLLRNLSPGNSCQGIDVLDRHGRPAIGARVKVQVGRHHVVRELCSGGSYLASSQPRLFHARRALDGADSTTIQVDWPWGGREVWRNPTQSRLIRLHEGEGSAVPP